MYSLMLPAILLAGGATMAGVPDIYQPYLDNVPEIVEELPERETDGVIVREMWLLTRELEDGQRYEIHCVLARPTTPGPHPGMVFCHGGGGYVDRERKAIVGWARDGYVCIGVDSAGFSNRSASLSRGPYYDSGGSMYDTHPDPTASPMYDGVVAQLRALALLRSLPEVDPERVGVFGGSWGGYMTHMVTALGGERVKAMFAIYGAGYHDKWSCWLPTFQTLAPEDVQGWITYLDPGRLVHDLSADYMILAADNDWFFWPPAVEATIDNIPAEGPGAEKNWLFGPNDYHAIRYPGGTIGPGVTNAHRTTMEVRFMDWKLKGEAAAFPVAQAVGEPVRDGDDIRVRFSVESELPIASASVYCSGGEMPWRFRWWERVEPELVEEGVYEVRLPVTHPEHRLDWVAVVSDEGNASVSTRIGRIEPAELGFDPQARNGQLFAEDFEGDLTGWRWRWTPLAKRGEGGSWGIREQAAREGQKGIWLRGTYSCGCWGIRAADIVAAGGTGLKLWAKSATEEPVDSFQVELVVELEHAARHMWRAQPVADATLTDEWQQFDLTWADFVCQGEGEAPSELLCDGLGELRFTVEETGQEVYIDDIEFVAE